MSVVRTLAWCFHILEMSSIHTGEHTKQQRFKSKRRKIANGKDCVTFHRTTAGSYEKFSVRHERFLISASLKVRPRTDDKDVQDSCCFFGLWQGRSQDFSRGTPDFFYIVFPTHPPHPKFRHFFTVPLLKVGLRVVSQSTFAVYEMTQPLKFLNSVGLLGSLTSSVYHYSAIKNQVCSTSYFSLQMTVFYRFLSHCF